MIKMEKFQGLIESMLRVNAALLKILTHNHKLEYFHNDFVFRSRASESKYSGSALHEGHGKKNLKCTKAPCAGDGRGRLCLRGQRHLYIKENWPMSRRDL